MSSAPHSTGNQATGADVSAESPDDSALPAVPSTQGVHREVVTLQLLDPFRWLIRGAGDFAAAWGIGLFYGGVFLLLAWLVAAVFHSSPEYTLSIASGCLLLGPFLAMGLYDVSRRREAGLTPSLGASLTCWDSHGGSMGMLVMVLVVLELLWGRASLVVFAVFFNTGMPSTTHVAEAVFNPANFEFLAVYLVVGGFFAAVVFSIAVISIPMILDRDTDAISASITSLQVVATNPAVMLCWGALITLLVVIALLPWGLGLLVLAPWLGHASWHAYRGCVRWPVQAQVSAAPAL